MSGSNENLVMSNNNSTELSGGQWGWSQEAGTIVEPLGDVMGLIQRNIDERGCLLDNPQKPLNSGPGPRRESCLVGERYRNECDGTGSKMVQARVPVKLSQVVHFRQKMQSVIAQKPILTLQVECLAS